MHPRSCKSVPVSRSITACLLVAALAVAGCSGSSSNDAGADRDCITDFDANTDYFPDKSTITDATGLAITYHKSYQVLTVKEPAPGAAPASYVLVRCGAPTPKLDGALADAPQVEVPIRTMYSGSTTHLPAMAALGAADAVTGVSTTDFVSTPQVRSRIDEGKVTQYAEAGVPNVEKVIAGRPDVLVSDGMDDPSYPKLQQAGIDVLADADWLEASPLGRAEWIKFFGALTGHEKAATEVFDGIKRDYNAVAAKVANAPKTNVLLGGIENGTWTMAAGGSYFGRLTRDAGGDYPWAGDRSTGSLRLSIESVIDKQRTADAWILSDMTATSLDAVYKQDDRYRVFTRPAERAWNALKAVNASGGNDYWERGVLRPDLVLGDLSAILHPDLFPDHDFEFYLRLPVQ
ncbi:ABC transporter substrate-binding protein [Gordonia liuliyuniae]|uniref:ABC transporter substrate-binding protein n=1 Tax=Gordonia liuliyuniae TaxID=2911517 RepID=A0ABS9ISQ3_9ACTN|nr:ABC transporter substrate-binding protein [Gordonia liuliyuniae]MCF8588593.1 ABC transporter substrate-binding protein [Gordonia liuliyuniae]